NYLLHCHVAVLQPQMINHLVWALSSSLAATKEIDLSFSSCSYLDDSVHCVFLCIAVYSLINNASLHWVPPFGYLWITAYLPLPEAFRSSSRPSSAVSA